MSELKRSCELHEEHNSAAAELRKIRPAPEEYILHNSSLLKTPIGNMFAIDRGGRWLAMSAPDGAHPSRIAEEVQEFLRHAGADVINPDLFIDVDLICSRSRLFKGIAALESVIKLAITVKLPNQGDTYREARRRMRELGAWRREEIYENPDGLTIRKIPRFAEGVETGDIDLIAESSTGRRWALSDSPEEFDADQHREGVSLAALLLLAIAWIVGNWPGGGGGTS